MHQISDMDHCDQNQGPDVQITCTASNLTVTSSRDVSCLSAHLQLSSEHPATNSAFHIEYQAQQPTTPTQQHNSRNTTTIRIIHIWLQGSMFKYWLKKDYLYQDLKHMYNIHTMLILSKTYSKYPPDGW